MAEQERWQQLFGIKRGQNQINEVKIQGKGDWSCNFYKALKQGFQTEDEVYASIKKIYEIEDTELDISPNNHINTLKEALQCLNLKIEGEAQELDQKLNVGQIVSHKTIVDDGNTQITKFEDENFYYYIFFETSWKS